MKSWKKKLLITAAILLGLAVLLILLNFVFVESVVDFWWFQSQGLGLYVLMRWLYRYVVFGCFTAIFFVFFYVNFWIAARFVGNPEADQSAHKKALFNRVHSGLQRFYLPFSVLLALPIAIPMFSNWEKALLFIFSRSSGTTDPLFGKDISFYLFSLPIYDLIQKEILLVAVILFLGVLFLYWYEHRLLASTDASLPKGARLHLNVLALAIIVVLCWGLMLERYDLLYETVNLPVFFGPGYVEMRIILPLIWLSMIFLAGTGIALVVGINRKKGWKTVGIFALLFIAAFSAKNTRFFVDSVRKYVVAPNQIIREQSYIEASTRATLAAFGLDAVETLQFETSPTVAFDAQDPDLIRRLQNIPVWDREMLGSVFEELQGIRTYYAFPTIDVDRYSVEESYRQVYLGAREIALGKLPPSARNWINIHLQYTHGQGVAMIPAAQAGDEFMTWFIKDIPPQSDFGLTNSQSFIYFGLADKPYVLVPNDAGEIGHPLEKGDTIVNYDGTGGVSIDSILKKGLFAYYFKDRNIFFTTKTNERSRILFRRNIIDQAEHITPFLWLDQDPYIVNTPDGLFWIQDAYTTADNYPLTMLVDEGYNYIRNAVKIVTDAYNGTVSYYIADTTDPIIDAYRRMYPGVFRPLAEMPAPLRRHLRYPRDIFQTQVAIYANYHQTDPEVFYRQEDIWEFSKLPQNRELVPAKPYYLTLDLIDPGQEDFLLFMPLSPFGRDNLRALMIAGSDSDNYGKIFTYLFPRNQQVYGPAQIHSLVNQDVIISEQFTLWNQEGSEVILGKMIIEPTNGSLLYIQPVYLQESGKLKIPQLKRIILALNDAVVMAPSLEEAAVKLEAELVRKSTRRVRPLPRRPASDASTPEAAESAPPANEPTVASPSSQQAPHKDGPEGSTAD